MKPKIILYVTLMGNIILSTLSCTILQKNKGHDSVYDYLVIKEIYQKGWIDKERKIFMITLKNNQILDVYLNGLEDNYIPCLHSGTLYKTDSLQEKIHLETVKFSDVSYFSETNLPFPKKYKYEFKDEDTVFKVYKVKIIGCVKDWETIGIKSKNPLDHVLLPIKMESIVMSRAEKKYVKRKIATSHEQNETKVEKKNDNDAQ